MRDVVEPDEIPILLLPDPDQPDALGYHEVNTNGIPSIKVFPLLDTETGGVLSVTISHEIAETLVDPGCNICSQNPADGKIWAVEIADAVEQDSYTCEGELVSNFVLPKYFAPTLGSLDEPLDFMEKCMSPYEIRPGGYGQTYDGRAWHQHVNGEMREYRKRLATRRMRRAISSALFV